MPFGKADSIVSSRYESHFTAVSMMTVLIGAMLVGCAPGEQDQVEDRINRGACKEVQAAARILERDSTAESFVAFLTTAEEVGLKTDTDLGTALVDYVETITTLIENGDSAAIEDGLPVQPEDGSAAQICSDLGIELVTG